MVVSNLKKSYYKASSSGNIPIPVNGSDNANTNIWINTWGAKAFFLSNAEGNNFSGYNFQKYNANSPNSGYYVAVGFGNTAETYDDYKLADMQGIDHTYLTHKYGYVRKDPSYNVPLQVESVYENAGSTDVIVKEVGLIANINNSNGDTNWQMKNFLIARKVLTSPVTIHAGEIYKFIYKIDF